MALRITKKALLNVVGVGITILYLMASLITLQDYGVTWDFTYHFNAGLWHLKQSLTATNFIMGPSPPLSDTLPTLGNILFAREFKLLPWDVAYNLYSTLLGSLGIGILYFFVKELTGNWKIALFSSISLAFLPRYFGHLHNNMKDIPQAVFFTLALWFFWRLFKQPTVRNLILASIGFALSFNSKVNGIFVPIIAGVFMVMSLRPKAHQLFRILYFISAPLFALALWWPFWDNPVARVLETSHSYSTSTTNMPLLYFGKIVYSGNDIPWHYPFGLLGVTTPVVLLISAVLGFLIVVRKTISGDQKYLLLLLWFLLPSLRYFKPHMIVIDDVRHFMELLFPLAVFSGIGLNFFSNKLLSKGKFLFLVFNLSLVTYLLFNTFKYHPYQTSYYNELVGGIKGAEGKFDIEFWCHSYKELSRYINTVSPQRTTLAVSMCPDIAKLYLRSDLVINNDNMAGAEPADYEKANFAVIMNRQSFFDWYGVRDYLKDKKPLFSVSKEGIPLVSVYKNY